MTVTKNNKTMSDIAKFLRPLYKPGKPFIVSEKDYKWMQKVMFPKDPKKEFTWNGEKVWFDTLKTKVKPKLIPCRWCNKTNGVIKFYIIADNLEEPKAYHPGCLRKLEMEVIMKLGDNKAQINPQLDTY